MAIDTNIFKNSGTDAIKVTPKEWANEIEQFARETNIMRGLTQSVVIYDRIGAVGNSITITKNNALTASALTDGVATPIQPISFNQLEITAQEHGAAVQFTKKQLRDQLPTVRADVISLLGEALGNEEESVIISELDAVSGAEFILDKSGVVMSKEIFNESEVKLRVKNRDAKYFVVHPAVAGTLRISDDFVHADKAGTASIRNSGFIGTFLGVETYTSTNVPVDSTDPANPIYTSLMLGARALAMMIKKNATLDIDPGMAVERSVTFHTSRDYGVKRLNDESIMKVLTL